ncbi:MAG TPA: G-D-S-L family lipolytic protein, partial [Puia sp.]
LGDFEKDGRALIHSFKERPTHPRIILLLPLPCFLKDTTQINDRIIVSQIIPALRQLAYDENIEVLDMHSLFMDRESGMPDKIHPDGPGSHLIAERLFHLIAQTGDWQFDIFRALHHDFKSGSFNGYASANFTLDGKACLVVKPKWTAAGRPWIWRARFWGHEPQTDIALLERGFHLVYCDVSELFGNEEAVRCWNDFYDLLHRAGLGKKAVLEGMSRGAVYALNWAAVNPDKVNGVYIDNPVLDLKSWPAGLGRQPASPEELEILKADYRLKGEDDLRRFKGSPVDNIPQIASGHYPILILCADADDAVPPEENTLLFERKFRALQGDVWVLHKPGFKHHPHSLPDPTPIVDFILKATAIDQ